MVDYKEFSEFNDFREFSDSLSLSSLNSLSSLSSPFIPSIPSISLIPCGVHLTFHLLSSIWLGLLPKDKIDGGDKAGKACEVVPLKWIALDKEYGKEREDHQRDNLLDNLELPERKWTAQLGATYAVGGHLKAVLK